MLKIKKAPGKIQPSVGSLSENVPYNIYLLIEKNVKKQLIIYGEKV